MYGTRGSTIETIRLRPEQQIVRSWPTAAPSAEYN